MKSLRMQILAAACVCAVCAILGPSPLGAQSTEPIPTIRVTPGGAPLMPMAIPDFVNKSDPVHDQLGVDGALILSRDLDLSFYFEILNPSRFIRTPTSSLVDPKDFGAWIAVGADALIAAEYTVDDAGVIEVTLRLYDVPRRRALIAKRYRGTAAIWRDIMHSFADEVLLAITGRRGPFFSHIAFASARTGHKEIYIADPDGKDIRQVTADNSINIGPAFRPDGAALIYTSYALGAPSLMHHDLTTGAVRRLFGGRGLTMAGDYSPDGHYIAFSHSPAGDSDLYMFDLRKNAISRLTRSWGLDISPSFSPDGEYIAFASDKMGQIPQIYVMPAHGGPAQRISDFKYSVAPSWSPQGGQIAFAAREEGQLDIVIADVDETGRARRLRNVTKTPQEDESPAFSPDGRYLIYASNNALWIIPAREGYEPKLVLRLPGALSTPAWSPHRGGD